MADFCEFEDMISGAPYVERITANSYMEDFEPWRTRFLNGTAWIPAAPQTPGQDYIQVEWK